ncbi:MAG: NADH-quinone oxidoreductase subunit M [Ignavibacteria bacterium]|jgi:NADH-quinone oxidoreductase subunit M|nr:NADH-quinone oxidoreductase subunit M [Ignavibacteria bacterium]
MFTFLGLGPLSLITFLPILGILAICLIPKGKDEANNKKSINCYRGITVALTFIQLLIAIAIYAGFDWSMPGVTDEATMQFVEKVRWIDLTGLPLIGDLHIEYFMGIDGISAPMIMLTAIVCFVATFASWNIKKAQKGYFAMYLLLDLGMIGLFCALDFFLFFVFWEIMLLPMYFLIGIWGGPRREYAAIKFFIYTFFGSVFILLVMIGLYLSTGTFNLIELTHAELFKPDSIFSGLNTTWRYLAFAGLFVGFAIKVPTFPFHTWLPDAHVEAPTPISVILAGVLLKMGVYGMLRICWPIFPDAFGYFQWWIALIGVIGIVYGGLCALGQHKIGAMDMKKMIAYSSISHMGYVVLGVAALNPQGVSGAIFQMFNHGTITSMLFLIVGVIYDRAHTRSLDAFGGLANKMPIYTALMTIAFFAAIGLPGMSGFVSEVLCFVGGFNAFPVLTIIGASGIIIGAAYMLWALQRVFFGQLNPKWEGPWDPTHKIYKTDDVNGVEKLALIPLAVIIIFLGIQPHYILGMMSSSVNGLITFMQPFLQ